MNQREIEGVVAHDEDFGSANRRFPHDDSGTESRPCWFRWPSPACANIPPTRLRRNTLTRRTSSSPRWLSWRLTPRVFPWKLARRRRIYLLLSRSLGSGFEYVFDAPFDGRSRRAAAADAV